MVDRKENYKFNLGVKGLKVGCNLPCADGQAWKGIRSEKKAVHDGNGGHW